MLSDRNWLRAYISCECTVTSRIRLASKGGSFRMRIEDLTGRSKWRPPPVLSEGARFGNDWSVDQVFGNLEGLTTGKELGRLCEYVEQKTLAVLPGLSLARDVSAVRRCHSVDTDAVSPVVGVLQFGRTKRLGLPPFRTEDSQALPVLRTYIMTWFRTGETGPGAIRGGNAHGCR